MLSDPLCYEPSSSCSRWEVLPDLTILMCKQLSAEKNGCHWEVDSCLMKAAVCLKICEGENTWKSFDPIPCHLLFLRHHPSSHVSGHRMRTPEMARHAVGVTFQRWIVRTLGQSMRASPPRLTVEINSSTCFCLCYLVPAFFFSSDSVSGFFFQVCGWAGELGKDIHFLFASNALTKPYKNCDFHELRSPVCWGCLRHLCWGRIMT